MIYCYGYELCYNTGEDDHGVPGSPPPLPPSDAHLPDDDDTLHTHTLTHTHRHTIAHRHVSLLTQHITGEDDDGVPGSPPPLPPSNAPPLPDDDDTPPPLPTEDGGILQVSFMKDKIGECFMLSLPEDDDTPPPLPTEDGGVLQVSLLSDVMRAFFFAALLVLLSALHLLQRS